MTQEDETFTAKIFLRFIRKLWKEFPSRKIVLIADGDPLHIVKIVHAYQEKHQSWLHLKILPACSLEFIVFVLV